MISFYRFLGVVALCLTLPACGGGGSDSDVVIPPIGPFVVTILEDDFSAGNLSNWTVQTGNVAVIPGGNPGPSMSMDGSVATASVRTAANFGVANPLKVSFRIDAGNSPTFANNGTFSVINNAAPAPINTFVSFTDTVATFSISGVTTTIAITMGGGSFTWRRFIFEVDTVAGTGTWSLDGIIRLSAPYAASTVHVFLTEQGAGLTLFDNFLVSSST